ncbi:MAG: FAD-dependent oxidoreductase [Dongiaceae bacterium]
MTATADAVVIGGGVIGAACAEALSRLWPRVTLVERLGLAAGTSSACQSGVGHGVSGDAYDLGLDRAAIDAYRALVADGLDAGYERTGALLVCREAEAASVAARLPQLAALGFDCAWLDPAALQQAEPRLAPGFAGALRLSDMGQVSPMKLVHALARRAAGRGATIRTGTEVTAIELERGRVAAVATSGGRIATPRVVIAGGVWSRALAALAGLSLPVWPLKGHVLVTEPLPGLLRHYVTEAEYEAGAASFAGPAPSDGPPAAAPPRVAAVLQPLPSGQLLIGSSREFAEDREVSRARLAEIARRACRLVPLLARRRVIRSYAGLRPWTPDGRPLIGPTAEVEGLALATGHAGEGNTRALITGRLVADLLAGMPPPLDPRPLSPDRFALRRDHSMGTMSR